MCVSWQRRSIWLHFYLSLRRCVRSRKTNAANDNKRQYNQGMLKKVVVLSSLMLPCCEWFSNKTKSKRALTVKDMQVIVLMARCKFEETPCAFNHRGLESPSRWCMTVSQYHNNTYIHNWPLQPISQDYWASFSYHKNRRIFDSWLWHYHIKLRSNVGISLAGKLTWKSYIEMIVG